MMTYNLYGSTRFVFCSLDPDKPMFVFDGSYRCKDDRLNPEKSLEIPRGAGFDAEDVTATEASDVHNYTFKILSRAANSTQGNKILSTVPKHLIARN